MSLKLFLSQRYDILDILVREEVYMQENILKTSNVTKIFLNYVDGGKFNRKEEVKLRYMDSKHCYFIGSIPRGFNKPKWRAKADVVVYTPDGIYTATVIIRDSEYSLNNIFYKVDIPKSWKFTQLRSGSRKQVELPLVLKFNDGLEIEAKTFDLAVGGFSFIGAQELSTVHTRFACNCQIQFPKDLILNFPDGLLQTDAKYVRQKAIKEGYNVDENKLLCFKFLNLSPDNMMILKNYLMKIE